MNKFAAFLLFALMPAFAGAASAVSATDGWIRAMPPGAKNSAGYVVLKNDGDADDALVGARVEGVRVTEIHEMAAQADGTMVMRRVAEVPVPAHGSAALAPGGRHLMLIGLERPLQPGDRVRATLQFRAAGKVKVKLDVRAP